MLFRSTELKAVAGEYRVEDGQERLSLTVHNRGAMTALFCSPEPMLEYRTDLHVHPNYVSIPPGESRTIDVRAALRQGAALGLEQLGWRLNCWNADTATIEPALSVLFALGRRDAMSYFFDTKARGPAKVQGRMPEERQAPHLLGAGHDRLELEFDVDQAAARQPAWLCVDTADRSASREVALEVTVNDKRLNGRLPPGYGLQQDRPSHLAQPASVVFDLSAGMLRAGRNRVMLRLPGEGWLTWDAVSCFVAPGE